MKPPSNDNAGSPNGTKGPGGAAHHVAPTASVSETLDAIAVEGERERWRSAKLTARAVFRQPALVTPRRMALLGDQGLSAFVNEVRSLAKAMILNERRKSGNEPVSEEITVDDTPKREAPKPPRKMGRRPAPFKLTRPPKPTALGHFAWAFRPDQAGWQFATDAVVWSVIATVFLTSSIALSRFIFLTFR